jgi:hypothetical protein
MIKKKVIEKERMINGFEYFKSKVIKKITAYIKMSLEIA